jgi:glycolate oxidase
LPGLETSLRFVGARAPRLAYSHSTVRPDALLDRLARVVPPGRLLTDAGALAPYESDGLTTFRGRPRAVVLVESTEEVVQTVRCCHEADVPFMARGSGTSLSGGAVPIDEGIVIALNRLNKILRIDPEARLAVVQPGVVNLDVSTAAATHGLYYAPDPSSQSVCTIGGNVAFNSGGAHCFRHGMTANHVLGLTVVLPDGEIARLGGESIEQCGADLAGLFIGSEGLFGIAVEITLRLIPRPESYRTVLAAYPSLQAAGDAVSLIVRSGLLPGAMEIMDRLAIDAAEAAVDAGYPPGAAAILIVELEGDAREVDAEFARLTALIESSGATSTRVASDAHDRARIWKGRKCAFSAVGRLSPDFIVQDGVVPRTKLGEALAAIERLSGQHGIRVANVFHAGDGNLHPLILFDGREAGALERAEQLAADILRLCISLGGSITGEHGVGLEKRAFLGEMFGDADMSFMQRLRQAVDPRELANRGKMLDGAAAATSAHGLHPLEKAGVISRV